MNLKGYGWAVTDPPLTSHNRDQIVDMWWFVFECSHECGTQQHDPACGHGLSLCMCTCFIAES